MFEAKDNNGLDIEIGENYRHRSTGRSGIIEAVTFDLQDTCGRATLWDPVDRCEFSHGTYFLERVTQNPVDKRISVLEAAIRKLESGQAECLHQRAMDRIGNG